MSYVMYERMRSRQMNMKSICEHEKDPIMFYVWVENHIIYIQGQVPTSIQFHLSLCKTHFIIKEGPHLFLAFWDDTKDFFDEKLLILADSILSHIYLFLLS